FSLLLHPAPRSTLSPTRRSSDLCSRKFRPSKLRASSGLDMGFLALLILWPRTSRPCSMEWLRLTMLAGAGACEAEPSPDASMPRSEEHTSELQSRSDLVCRLLLE